MGIATTEINCTVGNSRRGLNTNLVMNVRIHAGFETPLLFSACSIDGVEVAVPAANKKRTARDCSRGVDHVAGLKLPLESARGRIQGVDTAIAAAEIDGPIPNRRRGKIAIEGIGHGFRDGQRAMNVPGREPALTGILKPPL